MEETTIQKSPVPVRRSGRTGFSPRTTNNRPMLPAECHAAERADTTRPEIIQKDKSDTSMECETDKTALEDEDT